MVMNRLFNVEEESNRTGLSDEMEALAPPNAPPLDPSQQFAPVRAAPAHPSSIVSDAPPTPPFPVHQAPAAGMLFPPLANAAPARAFAPAPVPNAPPLASTVRFAPNAPAPAPAPNAAVPAAVPAAVAAALDAVLAPSVNDVLDVLNMCRTEGAVRQALEGLYADGYTERGTVESYVAGLAAVTFTINRDHICYTCPLNNTPMRLSVHKGIINAAYSRLETLWADLGRLEAKLAAENDKRRELIVNIVRHEIEAGVYNGYRGERMQEERAASTTKVDLQSYRRKLHRQTQRKLKRKAKELAKKTHSARRAATTDTEAESDEEPTTSDAEFISDDDDEPQDDTEYQPRKKHRRREDNVRDD